MVVSTGSDQTGRIAAAIAAAERQTSGEIYCVLARRVSSYRDVALAWATGVALLMPLAFIPIGLQFLWLPGVADGWTAGHVASQNVSIAQAIGVYAICQAVLFLIVFLLASVPSISRVLTPRAVRRARVRQAAIAQFLAHGIHVTENRTGVLLFASLADKQVEVVADRGIHQKVAAGVWGDAAAALSRGLKSDDPAGGFEVAVGLCGAVLAEHFPPRGDNPNEIADRLVLI